MDWIAIAVVAGLCGGFVATAIVVVCLVLAGRDEARKTREAKALADRVMLEEFGRRWTGLGTVHEAEK